MNPCPSLETLQQLLAGQAADGLRDHVNGCLLCQASLERLTAEEQSGLLSALDPTPVAADPALGAVLDRLRQSPPAGLAGSTADGPAPAWPEALNRLGTFELVRPLGSGATSVVFLARDTELDRLVAIKVLRPELACLPTVQARFTREARAAAALRHEHIVAVHQVLQPAGAPPCLVMEYVPGESLADLLKRQGALPPSQAAAIVEQVARGLAAAHAQGMVHRDIKPSNILLDPVSQRARIADFGLVCHDSGAETMTADGQLLGTPAYMSPEQASGQRVDARSDLFSLGAVLYHLLAGRQPFIGNTRDVLYQVVHEEPPPLRNLPRDLQTVTLQCLAKDPGRRYPSATDLADDLERWRRGLPVRARPVGMLERAVRWGRRRALVLALAALAAGLLLAVVLALALLGLQQHRQRQAEAVRLARAHQRSQLLAYQREGMDKLSWGEIEQARALFLQALPLAQALASSQPNDGQARDDLVHVYLQLGEVCEDEGEDEAARRWLEQARTTAEDWLAQQPHSRAARRALAKACEKLALALAVGPEETLRCQRRAVELYEELHRLDPADRPTRRSLLEAYLGLADMLESDNDPAAAEVYRKFDSLYQQVEAETTTPHDRAELLLLRARSLAFQGEHEAIARLALEVLQLGPRDEFTLYDVACCYAQCVAALERKHPEPRTTAQKSLRERYATQAFDHLRQAIAAGFNDRNLLRIDPDWEPLREHPEFRRLINRLKKR